MSFEIINESDFAQIKCDKANDIILVEWKQNCIGESYRTNMQNAFEFSKNLVNAKYIISFPNGMMRSPEDAEWERQFFIQNIIAAGTRQLAYAIPNCDEALRNQLLLQSNSIQISIHNDVDQACNFFNVSVQPMPNLGMNMQGQPMGMSNPGMNMQGQPMGMPNPGMNMQGQPMGMPNPGMNMQGQPMGMPNPGMNMQGQPMGIPNVYVDPTTFMTQEDNNRANKLCIISLSLTVGMFLLMMLFRVTGIDGSVVSFLDGLTTIAGFVLMIYVRVRYPKNIFGKVLMWLYIAFIIIYLLILAVILASCGIALKSCDGGSLPSNWNSCG